MTSRISTGMRDMTVWRSEERRVVELIWMVVEDGPLYVHLINARFQPGVQKQLVMLATRKHNANELFRG